MIRLNTIPALTQTQTQILTLIQDQRFWYLCAALCPGQKAAPGNCMYIFIRIFILTRIRIGIGIHILICIGLILYPNRCQGPYAHYPNANPIPVGPNHHPKINLHIEPSMLPTKAALLFYSLSPNPNPH